MHSNIELKIIPFNRKRLSHNQQNARFCCRFFHIFEKNNSFLTLHILPASDSVPLSARWNNIRNLITPFHANRLPRTAVKRVDVCLFMRKRCRAPYMCVCVRVCRFYHCLFFCVLPSRNSNGVGFGLGGSFFHHCLTSMC